jgi:hypothetical protein
LGSERKDKDVSERANDEAVRAIRPTESQATGNQYAVDQRDAMVKAPHQLKCLNWPRPPPQPVFFQRRWTRKVFWQEHLSGTRSATRGEEGQRETSS